jgi:hypothetical protein
LSLDLVKLRHKLNLLRESRWLKRNTVIAVVLYFALMALATLNRAAHAVA